MRTEYTVNAVMELYAFDKTREQKNLHFQQTKSINNIIEKNFEQNNQTEYKTSVKI